MEKEVQAHGLLLPMGTSDPLIQMEEAQDGVKARNWVATLWLHNAYRDLEDTMKDLTDTGKCRFIAYGEEVCPDTGTLHYQAYVVFYGQQYRSRLIKLFGEGHRFDPMRGTLKQNEVYCSKEHRFHKLGDEPKQGERNDLIGFKRLLDAGATCTDVAMDNEIHFGAYAKYHAGLEKYKRARVQRQHEEDGFRKPDVFLRYGTAGSGKSRWVFDTYGYKNVTVLPAHNGRQWFPGDIRDVVLFDDVQAGKILSYSEFKSLTDGHPKTVECKGGLVSWHPKVIVFTSNYHPHTWWDLSCEDFAALERRCEIVRV